MKGVTFSASEVLPFEVIREKYGDLTADFVILYTASLVFSKMIDDGFGDLDGKFSEQTSR